MKQFSQQIYELKNGVNQHVDCFVLGQSSKCRGQKGPLGKVNDMGQV